MDSDSIIIRGESPHDIEAVRRVNASAFPTTAEADLVDALRAEADPFISLVAERHGVVVGHIAFSPIDAPGHGAARILGLGPMAVSPALQRLGIGARLVRAGLDVCRDAGAGAVVVLGHPAYYPRFGFLPADRHDLRCAYTDDREAFMALELEPGHLGPISGRVDYHPAFDSV